MSPHYCQQEGKSEVLHVFITCTYFVCITNSRAWKMGHFSLAVGQFSFLLSWLRAQLSQLIKKKGNKDLARASKILELLVQRQAGIQVFFFSPEHVHIFF